MSETARGGHPRALRASTEGTRTRLDKARTASCGEVDQVGMGQWVYPAAGTGVQRQSRERERERERERKERERRERVQGVFQG